MKRVSLVLLSSILFLCTSTLLADGEFDQLLINAEAGDGIAQTAVGAKYYLGSGVEKDYVEALKWFRKAAEQGDSDAQFNLGVMYGTGQGVAKDYVEALKWYRKAADQGNASAQNNLGLRYANGQGVEKDRFAGASLAGQRTQPGPEIEVEPVDQDDIANRKAQQHGAARSEDASEPGTLVRPRLQFALFQ